MGHTQQLFKWERTEPAPPKAEPVAEESPLLGVAAPAAAPRLKEVREADSPNIIVGENRPAQTRRPQLSREQKHAHIEDMTERALTQLGESLAAGKSETLTQYLAAMAKFHEYSFGNQMLIAFQAPNATHVAGFHTWKSLGRSVRRGEHGIMILAPITRKVGEVEERHEDGTAETKDVRRIVNVKPVYVFDISQTDGKELVQFAKVQGDPAEATAKLKAFVKAKGITLDYSTSLGGAEGRSEGGRIVLKDGHTPAEEFHVLVHEVAHELLHRGERRKETTKRSRELEAEAVAFVVCSAVGLDAVRSSTDYIHLYRGDTAALADSMEHIRRTANEILAAVGPKSEVRNPADTPHRTKTLRTSPVALPEPEPLDASVDRGNFGEDEYGPVRPTREEVRAITEHHAERLFDVLTRLQETERPLSRGSGGQSRGELIREKDRLLSAYQSGIALYEEDFGEAAARRLDAYVRHEVDKE